MLFVLSQGQNVGDGNAVPVALNALPLLLKKTNITKNLKSHPRKSAILAQKFKLKF